MTNDALIRHCRELRRLRAELRAAQEHEGLVAADIIGELQRRGLDLFVFDAGWMARLEVHATREVDEERFAAACREHEIDPDEAAACVSRRISVVAARRLFDGLLEFDTLCHVRPARPQVRLIETGAAQAARR